MERKRATRMHRGEIVADLSAAERQGVSEAELLRRFAELKSTAELRFTRQMAVPGGNPG